MATQDTLEEQVYAWVREALQSGRLQPGDKVTIRTIAEQTGTSMTPARGALARLVEQGALDATQGKSLRVPVMDVHRWNEIRDMRIALECLAIRRTALQATPRAISRLRSLARQLDTARQAGHHARDRALIARFQLTAYHAADAPLLSATISNLWLLTGPHLTVLYPGYIAAVPPGWRHRLCDYLDNHDADAAEAEIRRDLTDSLNYIATRGQQSGTIEPGHARRTLIRH